MLAPCETTVQGSTASGVAPTRATASAALTTRARPESRSNGAIDVPATSHIAQIAMIIAVSTAILAAASVVVSSARRPLPETAAMATQAFGLAMPREVPPATENLLEAAVGSDSGGARALVLDR